MLYTLWYQAVQLVLSLENDHSPLLLVIMRVK